MPEADIERHPAAGCDRSGSGLFDPLESVVALAGPKGKHDPDRRRGSARP